ncbi:MAG: phenylalanyl-tRNA synthetase alpha chain [Candidatus Cloacimonadota bacterium]|nr:phenylalanyl-tRNA synthetase alpha chain [Candidatus Cloacimonadota bacterium]
MENTDLQQIVEQASQEIAAAENEHQLNLLKSKYLGKKSTLNGMMKKIGTLPPEQRPEFGQKVNKAKKRVEKLLEGQAEKVKEAAYRKAVTQEAIDLTMPGRKTNFGSLHPITKVWRELEDIFMSLGFEVAEGNDIEDEFHNFDALNTPPDHPARELSDTFYIKDDVLLRTQTSTVQIRVMQSHKPPMRFISPGRCYRNDNDASHSPAFHQVEALVVDEGITFADLRDILNIFVKKMFGPHIESRIRPHFFPFTEPSAEIDIVCVNCRGKGCHICKNSGWLEMGGAGMVDPNVFDQLGIDSEKYTGYAFGLGIDRIAMLKYNIPDMRLLFENDIRFLQQFK